MVLSTRSEAKFKKVPSTKIYSPAIFTLLTGMPRGCDILSQAVIEVMDLLMMLKTMVMVKSTMLYIL